MSDIYDDGDYDPPTDCFCNAGNAPCSWCTDPENWCVTCEQNVNDCDCLEGGELEEPDEVEKIIYDDTPEIIKDRMREENTKIRIRNKRKSIRKTLGQ